MTRHFCVVAINTHSTTDSLLIEATSVLLTSVFQCMCLLPNPQLRITEVKLTEPKYLTVKTCGEVFSQAHLEARCRPTTLSVLRDLTGYTHTFTPVSYTHLTLPTILRV